MTQYLLSIYQPDGPVPDPETMAGVVAKLHTFNEQLQASAAWVFTAGLHAPDSATVVHRDGLITDGPYLEGKEHIGGSGSSPLRISMPQSSGGVRPPPRPVCRSRSDRSTTSPHSELMQPEHIAAVFRAEYGRAVSVLIRTLGDIGLAEDAVADAFATALRRWPLEGLPPARPDGS